MKGARTNTRNTISFLGTASISVAEFAFDRSLTLTMNKGSNPTASHPPPSITEHYVLHPDRNGVFRATSFNFRPRRNGPKPEVLTIDESSDSEIVSPVSRYPTLLLYKLILTPLVIGRFSPSLLKESDIPTLREYVPRRFPTRQGPNANEYVQQRFPRHQGPNSRACAHR